MTQENARRREFLGQGLLGLAGGTVALSSGQSASAQNQSGGVSRTALSPSGAPSADAGYSPGNVATGNRLVFVSGQGPEDRQADMETQIRQTFDRIRLVLEQADASFENVVILRSYWLHLLRDLPVFRGVRTEYLVEPYPASTAVGVPELAFPDLQLEIEAVAVV